MTEPLPILDEPTPRVPLRVNVVTIFPEFFTAPLGLSIPSRARDAGAVEYRVIDLRDFTHDRHRTVDDAPYGGGAGMVMKPGPFFEAVEAIGASSPIVLMSARGKPFSHADAVRFSLGAELTLLCGHYKDVDQRVADFLATEELSLGDFVMSGGEPAALAIVDANGPAPSRRDVRPRQRARRFILRSATERPQLHETAGVPRARCARGPALRRSQKDC
jgi:hypothetical protein